MPRVAEHRTGERIKVLRRPVEFSLWPTIKTTRRHGVQPRVFATNPWPIIRRSVRTRCTPAALDAALAFIDQSEDYFRAANTGGIRASKPVLFYYCFLNLAKALTLTTGRRPLLDRAMHGLTEKLKPGGVEFNDAYLKAFQSYKTNLNMFDDFIRATAGKGIIAETDFAMTSLVPQIVTGHRLWAAARKRKERFIALKSIRMFHDPDHSRMWLRIFVLSEDLTRLGTTRKDFLEQTCFKSDFREVEPDYGSEWEFVHTDDSKLLCFEQIRTRKYSDRPADEIFNLVQSVRDRVWAVASNSPPYRRYYAYMSPPNERAELLPQLASMYAVMYYLGSITRYRPQHFNALMEGALGPLIEALLDDMPNQFVYLVASEFARQEVAKAAVV